MKKFRYLPHTGDIKFQARGASLEEAFSNAALAFCSLMWDPGTIEEKLEPKVQVKGKDLEQLLVSFLEEILFLFETKGLVFKRADNLRIKKEKNLHSLDCILKGDERKEKYEITGEIKAITYNEMKIKSNKTVSIEVVVDV
ncbi:MAG: archease [Acidobacteriota bacterium]